MVHTLRALSVACMLALSACAVRSAHEFSLDTRPSADADSGTYRGVNG
jgi:hypothetical protein